MDSSDSTSQPKKTKCPQCGRLTVYSTENKFRPFCSERCKLIDLGAWADGSYKIPVSPSSSDPLSSPEDIYDEEDPGTQS
ncbi:DNA gyrase inhibitor YacG [Bdellovibrio sp. HCB2-146]|uniref:DNA gyrase inhibitor YacG n=1 Tax=Bdellovibrio sp. HCB2-146 TaxID=3394362 RepID=UPI0039BD6B07